MYDQCYGKTDRARELFRDIADNVRSADAATLEAASLACPQGIDIVARIAEVRERLA